MSDYLAANPTSLSTEKSGKYLYVGYTMGNFTNSSAITPFNIDAANLALTLTDQLSFDVPFNAVQMYASLAFVLFVGISGCHGGGVSAPTITPPPTPQVTPKGTYTMMVTGTADNLPPQTISLSLTVY